MLEIAAVAALVFLVFGVFFFLENGKLRQDIIDLDKELKELKHARSTSTSRRDEKKTDTKGDKKTSDTPSATDKEFEDARSEIKELKKQVYDLKQETKDLRKQAKDAPTDDRPKVADSDVVFELREEIAQLKAEISRLQTEARSEARTVETPRQEPKSVPEDTREADPQELRDLQAKLEKQIEAAQQDARKEVSEIESRLKKTAANVDKQRRRADNNDRAYKITQRQLDAAQERIELLEAQLKKAGFGAEAPADAAAAVPQTAGPREEVAAGAAVVKRKAKTPETRTTSEFAATPEPEPPVEEPGAEKPAAEEPVAEAPVAEAPVAEEPVAEEPVAEEPVAEAPVAEEPVAEEPAADDPIIEEPAAEEPVAEEPVASGTGEDADTSGGHTAILSSSAFAQSFSEDEPDDDEPPVAAEPQPEPETTDTTLKSKPVTTGDIEEARAADKERAAEEAEIDRGHTAMLSGAAVAGFVAEQEGSPEESEAESASPGAAVEATAGGPFGIPADVLADDRDEDHDPARSTQFAFPAQQEEMIADVAADGQPKQDGFARENAPQSGPRLASFAVDEGENPADQPTPDIPTGSDDPGEIGKRLGEQLSEIDDAWADLDID